MISITLSANEAAYIRACLADRQEHYGTPYSYMQTTEILEGRHKYSKNQAYIMWRAVDNVSQRVYFMDYSLTPQDRVRLRSDVLLLGKQHGAWR